jgi:hypothetical protein
MIIEVVDQGVEDAIDIEAFCCWWEVGDWFIA